MTTSSVEGDRVCIKVTVTGCACVGGLVHCVRITRASPWSYFLCHALFLTNVRRRRELEARRLCYVSDVFETRATVVRNLRSRFRKKHSRAL